MTAAMQFILIVLAYTVIGSAATLYMRVGLLEVGNCSPDPGATMDFLRCFANAKLIIGVVCYGVSFLLFLLMLWRERITYTLPIATGLSYMGSVLAARLLLGERVSPIQGVGIVVIAVGLLMVLPSK